MIQIHSRDWLTVHPSGSTTTTTTRPLYFSSAINGNDNHDYISKEFALNTWINVKIEQKHTNGLYEYSIYLNGVKEYRVINKRPEAFDNVKVYSADPWYSVQDGKIRDLEVKSYPPTGN